MGRKSGDESGGSWFVIIGSNGLLIIGVLAFLLFAAALINGVEFVISLIENHIVVGVIILGILDAAYSAMIIYAKEGSILTKIIGFLIFVLVGSVSSIVALVTCSGLLSWYVDYTFQIDIIGSVVMLVIGPIIAIILGFLPLGCKYVIWWILLILEEKIHSVLMTIVLYVIVTILAITINTTLVYYLGHGTNELISGIHNNFCSNMYQLFMNINPINRLLI